MAVFEPPLGLPFVDERYYVARPWVEWLTLIQTNLVEIEGDVDAIEVDIVQIDINTANIAVNAANITTNTEDITTNSDNITILQADVLANEAKAYFFASL